MSIKNIVSKILAGTGFVGVAMAAGAIVQPADVTGEFLQKSFVDNGIYEQTFDVPDGAVAMKVAVSRDAWNDKGTGVDVIKVTSDWYGKEWQLDKGIGGFTTDGGIRLDEKGLIAAESFNETAIPDGIGRKIRIRVISKSDFTSTVSVKFQTPSKTILGRLFNMAWAAIAHVQTHSGGNNCGTATSCAVAFDSNVVANNLLISACRYAGGGRTVTISDTRVSSWALAREHVQTNDSNGTLDLQYAIAAGSGADTVTCAVSGGAVVIRATASEFSGNATASVLDKVNSAEGNSATAASGSVTPTTDGQLLFVASFIASGGTFTAGTDFANLTQVPTAAGSQKLGTEYYIQPTAGAHDGTMTFSSQAWGAAIATFKAAGGGAVITPVQDSGFFNII